MKTQIKTVREHLIRTGEITTWTAITKYHITRLSHYIMILRREGMQIDTIWKMSNGKRYALYKKL